MANYHIFMLILCICPTLNAEMSIYWNTVYQDENTEVRQPTVRCRARAWKTAWNVQTGTLSTGGKALLSMAVGTQRFKVEVLLCVCIQGTAQRPHVHDQKMPLYLKFWESKLTLLPLKFRSETSRVNPFFNIKTEGSKFFLFKQQEYWTLMLNLFKT